MTRWLPVVAGAVGLGVAAGLEAEGALPPALVWHAAFMIVAWGVLIPAGAVIARYHKVTSDQDYPRVVDNPFWWNWHRGLQYAGVATFLLGLAMVLSWTGGGSTTTHGWLGLAVITIGVLQVVAALVRGSKGGPTDPAADPANPETWRGDHYDMTPQRRAFEVWHKGGGWLAVALSGVTIVTGIELAGSPGWLLFLAGVLAGATVLGILEGMLRGRWVDTCEALWGTDPTHAAAYRAWRRNRRRRFLRLAARDKARDEAGGHGVTQEHAR